jgi:nucleoside-diphosphate-sugar epimerase
MPGSLITGASGLIGTQLARRLADSGRQVVGISRRPGPLRHCAVSYSRRFGASLSELVQRHSVDTVVHCAHDSSTGGAHVTERGTLQWAEEARCAGVAHQIYISSLSAREDSPSAYGRVKYRLEGWFLQHDGVVVRPGLVIGNGGLFARMASVVRKLPVVPLIGGGQARVYFNGIDFLCDLLARIVLRWPGSAAWNVQQPQPSSLRQVLTSICESLALRRWLIPLPYTPCLAGAWLLTCCKLSGLGISYDNVVGVRQNDVPGLRSDFASLGGEPEDIRALVERAIR